jgi:hypothetical protein
MNLWCLRCKEKGRLNELNDPDIDGWIYKCGECGSEYEVVGNVLFPKGVKEID